jgi:endoglucanase
MRRLRHLAVGLCLLLAGAGSGRAGELSPAEWLVYLARYVAPEGRVVDTYNQGISHSEGQGYGMLLAVAFDDRVVFDQLWRWTEENLRVRDDRLFAWRWEPAEGGRVTDSNNATDGDLLIAWALLRAGSCWEEPAYVAEAEAILRDVAAKLVATTDYGPVLLPAAEGFERDAAVVVNPSYWVFPALRQFARHGDAELWNGLIDSGLELLRLARFGEWRLPPDWLEVGDGLSLPEGFEPVFGYNAVRIPLYLAWSELPASDELLEPFRTFWASFDGRSPPPATVDLADDGLGQDPLSSGGRAIMALTRFGAARPLSAGAMMPQLRPEDDYYASTLLLLSKLALAEQDAPQKARPESAEPEEDQP